MSKANIIFKNIVVIFTLAGILLSPVLVSAQTFGVFGSNSTGTSGATGSSSGGNINGYVKGLLPTIAKLPECQKAIGSGIKGLFRKAKKEIGPRLEDGSFSGKSAESSATVDDIGVHDEATYTAVIKQGQTIDNIDTNTESIKKKITCTEAIGRMVIKLLLQKITLATIEWIRNGNNGQSFFVQSTKYFRDIAKEEILGFGLEINDANKFPFGRAFLYAQANAFNNHFAQNAQFSLDKLIRDTTPQYTAAAFSEDFSQGGWGAWNAMTIIPANNPLGFNLLASNELSGRLAGTEMSTAQWIDKGLQSAGGWLPDSRCADPIGVTKEEHDAALAGSSNMYPTGSPRLCKRWESVTPGSIVASLATDAVGYPKDALLEAQDLNDAIAAVLDALLAKFTAQLTNEGLAALTENDNRLSLDSLGISDSDKWQTEKDFADSALNASSWLRDNPDFNIRTDFSQAVIDTQRTYIDKLEQQNAALPNLIKTVYQLDYCIPGPHPDWEEEAQIALETAESKIPDVDTIPPDTVHQLAGAFGGPINQIGVALGIGDGENDSKKLYAAYVGLITGLAVVRDDNLLPYSSVVEKLDKIFDRYVTAVNSTFIRDIQPGVASEAEAEFLRAEGYKKIIEDNKTNIAVKKSIVQRLINIKNKIDALNSQLASGSLSQDAYENALQPWTSAFGRLSIDMVSGNDIAAADIMWREIIDKTNYVYKDLLKGAAGCENDLGNTPWQILDTKRPAYPFDILYDYNTLAAGAAIPDPLNAGITNNMPAIANGGGPGFLSASSFTVFTIPTLANLSSITSFCSFYEQFGLANTAECGSLGNPRGPTYVRVSDLFNLQQDKTSQTIGVFERTLQIY